LKTADEETCEEIQVNMELCYLLKSKDVFLNKRYSDIWVPICENNKNKIHLYIQNKLQTD
jgi:hypothetical protein